MVGGENLNSDIILIDRVLRGDKKSFETLIMKYQDNIYGFLYKSTLSKEDTEDIMQEVLIKAFKNLYKLENKCNFYHWLFKITINTMNSHFKNRKNSALQLDESYENIKCDEKYTPESMLEIKEQSKELFKRLNILKEDQRNIVLLKFVHGFSYKEIAEILDIKEDTVRMKAFRAKKKLFSSNIFHEEKGGILNEV